MEILEIKTTEGKEIKLIRNGNAYADGENFYSENVKDTEGNEYRLEYTCIADEDRYDIEDESTACDWEEYVVYDECGNKIYSTKEN